MLVYNLQDLFLNGVLGMDVSGFGFAALVGGTAIVRSHKHSSHPGIDITTKAD
jgi:hypothetical protein